MRLDPFPVNPVTSVVELGPVAAAAGDNHIARAAISRRMRKLESSRRAILRLYDALTMKQRCFAVEAAWREAGPKVLHAIGASTAEFIGTVPAAGARPECGRTMAGRRCVDVKARSSMSALPPAIQ